MHAEAERANVSKELAVCTLLLGSPEGALGHLRLLQAHAAPEPDPQVVEFLQPYANEVEGVCAYAESWVQKQLQPSIEEYTWTEGGIFDLSEWAEQPAVRARACATTLRNQRDVSQ